MDYKDDIKYPESCKLANEKDIYINTIQLGNLGGTEPIWREIAKKCKGEYFRVSTSGGGLVINTPYDDSITSISSKINSTKIYYGSVTEQKMEKERIKVADDITKGSSKASSARRASFNISKAGKKNYMGNKELISTIADGDMDFDDLKSTELPEEMKEMDKKEQEKYIKDMSDKRKKLESDMNVLINKRNAYIKTELSKKSDKGKDSFTGKVFGTIREQAKEKKINYSEEEIMH